MVTSERVHTPPQWLHKDMTAAPAPDQARNSGPLDDCGCQTGRKWSTQALTVLVPIAVARGISSWSARRAAAGLALAAAGGFTAGAVGKAVGISRARRLRSGRL